MYTIIKVEIIRVLQCKSRLS